MKYLIPLAFALTGCVTTSILPLDGPLTALPRGECTPQVFITKEAAEKKGQIGKELCMISAMPAAGWDKTTSAAIQNGAPELCNCGTLFGYVKETSPGDGLSVGTVNIIGFEYISHK